MIKFEASDFQGFRLDLSDREIYNDIRSECDIWEILQLRPDTTPDYYEKLSMSQTKRIAPSKGSKASVAVFNFTAQAGESGVYFTNAYISNMSIPPISGLSQSQCESIEAGTRFQGHYENGLCYVGIRESKVRIYAIDYASDHSEMWAYVRNEYGLYGQSLELTVEVTVTAEYYRLDPDKRYVKLRSVNEDSIKKYGRRVMDIQWPMGIAPAVQQSMLDYYCTRYSEPVCMCSATILGKSDETISDLMSLEVDEKHEFVHPGLDMDEQFFINQIQMNHAVGGLLEATIDLEQVRDLERLSFFIVGQSLIGGDDVIAP